MHSPGGRGFFAHVTSWRFVLTLACLFGVDGWLETTTIAERATLGGFDTAREFSKPQDGTHTAVVGISGLETAKYFGGKRPIPAESLAKVVTRLMRLRPRVLVVDVFTDGADYRRVQLTDSLVLSEQQRIVWAQSADTANGEMMPVLGGAPNPPGRTGLAAILADQDRLVRRFRPRYASSGVGPASELIESLPLAAANAFVADGRDSARITNNVPTDTGSIALRSYQHNPPYYLLDDVMGAVPALAQRPDTAFSNRVLILGFVDGTDQVVTAGGMRSGPQVVADGVETLLDGRRAVRGFPFFAEWSAKIALALLVAFIHFRLPRPAAAASMVLLTGFVIYAGFLTFAYFGFWTNFVLIVVGTWIEQLYESATLAPPSPVSPEAAAVELTQPNPVGVE